jgi:uncharacterized protein (TIGR03663 family)
MTPTNHENTWRDALNVETGLWVLLVALALSMRLAQLGASPLTALEAREATLSWRAATGEGLPITDYNPVLLAGNGLLFTLLGSSDWLARFLPALFGAPLALSPLLFRQHVGRVGALATGLYLAISPTALAASRQLAGTTIAATGAMMCVGGLVRFFETKDRGWLTLAAVGLALAVTSGATAYALLLPLGLVWAVLSRPWSRGRASVHWDCISHVRPHALQFLVTFAMALFALCTGLGWNLSGVGAVGGLLVDWFGRFRPSPSPGASPLTLLIVYELLGLTFGIGGLILGLRRGEQLAASVGLWGGLELLLLALMPGRMPTDLLWAVLPLAFLTGIVVEILLQDWSRSDAALRAVYAALVLALWVYAYLMLGRYAAYGDRADLALAVIAVVVQALLGLSFGLALGPVGTLRAATGATGVALLAFTLSAGWGVAYEHPADPREALLTEPTAMGVHDLAQTLTDLSWQQTGMPTTLEFAFEAPEDSVLAWYLRGFERAHRVDRLDGVKRDTHRMILVTRGRDEIASAVAEGEYAGQDFAVRRQWSPQALGCRFWDSGCNVAFGWLLFRDAPPLPEAVEWATLWYHVDVTAAD